MHLLATRAVPPRRRAYAEVVVLGAHATAMWRRLDLVDRSRIVAPLMTVLVAPRPTAHGHPRRADGTRDELLGPGGRFPAAAGWSPPGATGSGPHGDAPPIATEAHLALLLLSRRWGLDVETALDRLGDRITDVPTVEVDLGRVAAFGAVVLRRVGHAVPGTTAGTLADWAAARRVDPAAGTAASAPTGPRLIVTSRPHLLRTRRVVAGTLGPASDAEVAAAPGPDHLPMRAAVGEARSLVRSLLAPARAAA